MRPKIFICAVAAVIATASVPTAQSRTQPLGVVITELHRDPAAGGKTAVPGGYSHSFVEVTNFGADTLFFNDVFLTNGKMADSVRLFDTSAVVGHDSCTFNTAKLPPGGIAVILPQSYGDAMKIAPSSALPIAKGTILLTVNRKTLCGGLANDDGIALYKGTRSRIISLIDVAANPGVSIQPGGLPGKISLNQKPPKGVSVVPTSLLLNNDKRYVVSVAAPLSPGRYEPLVGGVLIEYAADMPEWATSVQCSLAVAFVAESGEGASWRVYSHSSSGGARVDEVGWGAFENNQRRYLLTIDIDRKPRDYIFEITLSDARTISVPIDLSNFWAVAGNIRITEIYPRGSGTTGQPEWFELQNVSQGGINLNGWTFGGMSDIAALTAFDLILPSGQFIVVTKDSEKMLEKYPRIPMIIKPAHWIALNNRNDTLRVSSPRGVPADMAVYKSAWFGGAWTTQSLERVSGSGNGCDSVSWTLCNNPTPGFPGNADMWRAVSEPSMEIGPTPFRPNGKKVDSFLSIRLKAPPNYRIKLKILSFDGKLLKTFTDEKELIMWNGKTDKSRPAPPGPIYIVAEFTSSSGKKVTIRKNTILWR